MNPILVTKCETCGGVLELSKDGLSAKCKYCGNEYSFKKPCDENINRADNYRLNCLFDNAIIEYKTMLQNDYYKDNDKVYWGMVLATYGIEYIFDKANESYIPTCHRTILKSILQDEKYLNALKYSTNENRENYILKAQEIDELQKNIIAISKEIENYDIFICFKSTYNRQATEDRFIARKIFDELTKRGFNVFFSEITLKGKLGSDYEPIIYKALTTCQSMIFVCTNEEFIDAPFIRNEWSRFLDRKKQDLKLTFIPVFKNINPMSLPSKEQGIDLAKYPVGGYEVDLADNLESILGKRTIAKIDKEILEEYSKYNSINEIKFEMQYKEAMRDVVLFDKTLPSVQLDNKYKEMYSLGSYKNAQVLANKYKEQSVKAKTIENNNKSALNTINAIRLVLLFLSIPILAVGCYKVGVGYLYSYLRVFTLNTEFYIGVFWVLSFLPVLLSIIFILINRFKIKSKIEYKKSTKYFNALFIVVSLAFIIFVLLSASISKPVNFVGYNYTNSLLLTPLFIIGLSIDIIAYLIYYLKEIIFNKYKNQINSVLYY